MSRRFEFSGLEYWPYQLEGPAVFKVAYSYSEPYHLTPLSPLGLHGINQFFRLAAYDNLLRGNDDPEILKAVLGVTRPILELVPRSAFADDEAGGLALVLRNDGPEAAIPVPDSEAEEIRVSEFTGDRLSAEFVAPEEAVLVYRDTMAPGWSAALNGEQAELLVVDGVNKAIAVSPGQHRVEFVYRPWAYLFSFALRALVLLAALTACARLAARTLRRPRAT